MSDPQQPGRHIPGYPRVLAEPVPKDVRDAYVAAEHDLFWLLDHGALTGVAAILRERRVQIEEGRDQFRVTEPDPPGCIELTACDVRRLTEELAKSAALGAAHIDHLTREEGRQ